MNCITDVLALDRILLIALIVLLPAKTRYPQNVIATYGTNLVNNLLEILGAVLLRTFIPMSILPVAPLHIHRLIGKLKHNVWVVLQFLMAANVSPHLDEILLIVITNGKILRTYTRWTHNHIDAVLNSIFCHRNNNF